jgi:glycosyltransferase involved in cell wall biosynthesis
MQADVTVIMQNYNASMTKLRDAVYSVINQSFDKLAFIFIDDWSTDYDISYFFDEIKKEWNRRRPNMSLHLIKKPQSGPLDPRMSNHGHSFCRNWGLDLVKSAKISDYVFFADSDDELLPTCVQMLWDNMETDDEIDISIGNFTKDPIKWTEERDRAYRVINEDEIFEPFKPSVIDRLQALKLLCDPYMITGHRLTGPSVPICATWNKIFRVSVFDAKDNVVRFPDYKTKDDNFTAHRLIWNSRKIAFTPNLTYYYRPGGNLADRNLYKTADIVDAHLDRVEFFAKIFEDDIRNISTITVENCKEKILINRILADEHIVYLHTLMTVFVTCNDTKLKIRCTDELEYCVQLWKKEFMAYEPRFLEQCLNTKAKMLNEMQKYI